MTAIALDHVTVPCRDKAASARTLAELLGVPWAESGAAGLFAPLYVSDGLTLDFDQTDEPYGTYRYCFRVGDDAFDAILARIWKAGIAYRGSVSGPVDMQVATLHGGRIVYWNEPDGHPWELLTVSYARRPS